MAEAFTTHPQTEPEHSREQKDKQLRSFDVCDDGLLHARWFNWRVPGGGSHAMLLCSSSQDGTTNIA
jgi:hypothetical protein